MTNELTIKHGDDYFVLYRPTMQSHKNRWLRMVLGFYSIEFITVEYPDANQVQLFIDREEIKTADDILGQIIGTLIAETDNFDNGPKVPITFTIDDLPDDHEFFAIQCGADPVPVVTEVEVGVIPEGEVPEMTDNEIDVALGKIETALTPEPEPTVEEVYEALTEDTEESSGWDLDDDDDEDEDGDPLKDDPPLVEEVEETLTKKEKKTKVKIEANDPDFDDAEPAPTLSEDKAFERANEVLTSAMEQFPGVTESIQMYDAMSSNLSALGCKVTKNDPNICTIYSRFKTGGTIYRYNPVPITDWQLQLNELVNREEGRVEASAGSFFYTAFRAKADAGEMKCQRLNNEGRWVEVLPKSQRTEAFKRR